MEEATRQETRPTDATSAACIVIGLGAFALLASIGNALGAESPPGIGGTGPVWDWIAAHHSVLAFAQMALGLATAGCGHALLQRNRWAPSASRLLMIGWVLLFLGIGLWMTSWTPLGRRPEGVFAAVWIAASLGNAMLFTLLPAVVVWLLGRERVRLWYERK